MSAKTSSIPALYEFKAPFDNLVKAVTSALVVGLITLASWISYLALNEGGWEGLVVLTIVLAVIIPIIVVPYLFSPRAFSITVNSILVKRPLRSFLIPYDDIVSVKRVAWTWRGIRLCASGGLYGYFGLFQIAGLGRYCWWRRSEA